MNLFEKAKQLSRTTYFSTNQAQQLSANKLQINPSCLDTIYETTVAVFNEANTSS